VADVKRKYEDSPSQKQKKNLKQWLDDKDLMVVLEIF
jgi:hypothetical protein